MRLKHPDLALAIAIALANVLWVFLPYHLPAIGTALALPLVFILPGYTVTAVLFSRRSLDMAYRLLLSLGVSLSIVIVGGLLLNALPAGLRSSSWSALLAFLTAMFAVLGMYLRREQTTPIASIRLPWYGWIVCALAVLITALSVVFSASSVAQQPHAGFTQFWMLPAQQAGESCAVRLGVQSFETTSETFNVVLTANGAEVNVWPSIQLAPRQSWNQSISISPIRPGGVYIEARLYRANNPRAVYREVNLTLNCGERLRGISPEVHSGSKSIITAPVILSAAKNLMWQRADSSLRSE